MANKIKTDEELGFVAHDDEDLGFQPHEDSDVGFESTSSGSELPWYITGPKAGGLGAAQGATFGLADEAQAGISTMGEALKRAMQGKSSLDPELAGVYEQKRDEARGMYKQAQEESPVMYGVGEVGAGFIPGIGSLASLRKTQEGASLLRKMASGAETGAAMGGLAGFGYSEGTTPEDIAKDTIKGAGMGVVAGGAIPAVTTASSKLGAAATDLVGEYGGLPGKAFKAGTEGKNIASKSAASKTAIEAIQAPAREIQEKLFSTLDENFKKKMAILKNENAKPVNFDKLYQETVDLIDSKVGSGLGIDEAEQMKKAFGYKFLKELPEEYKNVGYRRVIESTGLKKGEIVPTGIKVEEQGAQLPPSAKTKDLEQFKLKTRELEPKVQTNLGPSGEFKGSSITKEQQIDAIKEAVAKGDISAEEGLKFVQDLQHAGFEKNISDPTKAGIFKDVARKASDIVEGVAPTQLEPLNKQSSNVYKVLDLLNDVEPSKKEYLSQKLMGIVQDMGKEFDPKRAEKVREFMDELQKALPESAKGLQEKAQAGAELADLARQVGGAEIHTSTVNPQNVLAASAGGLMGIAGKGANIAGLATKSGSDAASWAMKPGIKSGLGTITGQAIVGSEVKGNEQERYKQFQDNLYHATDDQLSSYAQQIQSINPNVSKQLQDAIQEKDLSKKNRMLFLINTTPNLKKEFKSATQ